uniref:Immunoglobulin domain-containing protein n=1 Tax=Oncorhynchus tshawytscha TaxID=74940 RepID=A0AAZ3R0G0_ONCTS
MVNLLVLTLKVVLLLAAVWSVYSAELITVEGYEGGKAEIRCPYREQLRSHQKYLCKGDCPVFNKNKVIKTEAGENSTSKGRYSLKDIREESVFIVTITKLMINDSGKYWCGVTNLLADDYTEVNLTVSRDTSVVIIVSGTLVMLLLVLVVSLLIVYRWKFNKETEHVLINVLPSLIMSSCPSPPFPPLQGCHGDGDYEEIKDRPLQSSSGSEITTIYSTANLPTRPLFHLMFP